MIVNWINKRNQKKLHTLYKDLAYARISHSYSAYTTNHIIYLAPTEKDFVILQIEYDFDENNTELFRTYKFVKTDNADFSFYHDIYCRFLMEKL